MDNWQWFSTPRPVCIIWLQYFVELIRISRFVLFLRLSLNIRTTETIRYKMVHFVIKRTVKGKHRYPKPCHSKLVFIIICFAIFLQVLAYVWDTLYNVIQKNSSTKYDRHSGLRCSQQTGSVYSCAVFSLVLVPLPCLFLRRLGLFRRARWLCFRVYNGFCICCRRRRFFELKCASSRPLSPAISLSPSSLFGPHMKHTLSQIYIHTQHSHKHWTLARFARARPNDRIFKSAANGFRALCARAQRRVD